MSENQNEIAPGRTFSSPGAAKVDAAEAYNATTGVGVAAQKRIDRDRATAAKAKEADDAATPAQKRVKAANANPALWDQKHPDHQKARKELLDAIAADATQDERDAYANLPIAELRDRFRLKAPRIPSNLTWNQEGEAEYLVAFHEQGVSPEAVRSLYTWYVDTGLANVGRFEPRHADEFRALAKKHGLSSEFTEKLIKFHAGDDAAG